jgi:hypothetical protein
LGKYNTFAPRKVIYFRLKPINAYQGIFLNILKLILGIGTLGFIGYKLLYAYNIGRLWTDKSIDTSYNSLLLFGFILLLMPIQWHWETLKWRIIMQKHEAVNATMAYKSVFTGIILGIITPNQIGDWVGKSMYLKTLTKLKGAAAITIGGIAQTIASFLVGSYGCMFLYLHLHPLSQILSVIGVGVVTLFNILLIVLFLHIHWLQKLTRSSRISQYLIIATDYNRNDLLKLLLYSTLRFILFTIQYFLLLHFFGIPLSLAQGAMSIYSIFIVQTFVPSFILVEIGVRGALALYFIGLFSPNTVGILLSAYSLWVINIMLPGLVGLYFLITHKWRPSSS